jgi:hypothetical protein
MTKPPRKRLEDLGGLDDTATEEGRATTTAPIPDLIKQAAQGHATATADDDRKLTERLAGSGAFAKLPSLTVPLSTSVSAQVPIKIMVPDYLNHALALKAAERGVTKRSLVIEALKKAGFHVDDNDMYEDGRRFRGRVQRS